MNWFNNIWGGGHEKSNGKKTPPKTPAAKQPAKGQKTPGPKTPGPKTPGPKIPVAKTPSVKSPPKAGPKKNKENVKIPKKEDKKEEKTTSNESNESKERKTKSLESLKSAFSPNMKRTTDQFGSRLSALNGTPPGQNMFDVCAYFLHCAKHSKIAVSVEEKTKYVWLPFISLPSSRTWNDGCTDGAYIVLSGGDANTYLSIKDKGVIEDMQCMQLFRLQLPQTQKFNIRVICYVKLSQKAQCCTDTKRLNWVSIQDIISNKVENLWGPEVRLFARNLSGPIVLDINEFSLDDAFTYVPRDPPRNLEEEMLKSCNFTEKDVERLYSDFIEHCFPAFFMTQTSFSDYMSKYGFEKKDKKLELLFRAFNFKNNNFLGFVEFLLGLTCIDPNANNGQSRVKFVFKYFDVDGDGCLSEKEFTSLIRELKPNAKEPEIKRLVKEEMNKFKLKKNGVPFDDFFKAVGSHKFRGTSELCRSNRPILAQISRSMASRTLKKTTGKSTLGSILGEKKYKGECVSCKEKKYDYALHKVKINAEGLCCEAQPLAELSQIEKIDKTDSKEKSDVRKESGGSSTGITGLTREKFSTDIVWNPKSVANHLLQLIREFNTKKGAHKDNKGVMDSQSERGPFVKLLKELCAEVEKIVVQEERCVKVSSPAFVIGDIHGNIEDLFTMEKCLWKSIPIVAANYVFLGDYVDRGKWGLECALYLFCLKLLAPNKIVLLRGNHEVRDLQKNYTYKKECYNKYGDSLGSEVYEATNKVFDRLPFCAVIDDAIFCAHGGIPCTVRQIEKINEVKTDLKDPERESAIAWEILWSDPIAPQQFAEAAELLKVRLDTAHGFLTNTKRGTAFLFGEEAANTFLQTNGLTHIIRAHEVPAQGYTFHFGNKCTTIFSSSHYCGNNNEAAAIHIDNEKLRIIRLDTVNNAPASD